MIAAVDSSALLSIFKGESSSAAWIDILIRHAAMGELRICDIVAAEVGGFFAKETIFREQLKRLNIELDPIGIEACHLAGTIFQKYRRQGGKREYLIPDFLIAAHAVKQADVLIASDRGYLRRYFGGLKVVGVSK